MPDHPDSRPLALEIDNLSCGGCASRAERALMAVPGVTQASVNFADGSARVDMAPQNVAALRAALVEAGYPARTRQEVFTVADMHCGSCVGRLEAALTAVPGVTQARVNLADASARVEMLSGEGHRQQVMRAARDAGYPLRAQDTGATQTMADRQAAEAATLRRKTLLAALLTLPVFVAEMGGHMVPSFHHWLHGALGTDTIRVAALVLTTAVLAGPGRMFFAKGLPALVAGRPDMNALVALGTGAAWLYSTLATLAPALLPEGAVHVYFESACVIVTLILLGRMLEARAKGRAGAAIARLVGLRPDTARLERDGGAQDVAVGDLIPGDVLVIRPGERIAVDGTVLEGVSLIDESMVSGEPVPVRRGPGDGLVGGTVNGAGALRMRVDAVGAQTTLARIVAMVQQAQAARLPIQDLVNRVTLWFVPAVLVIAVLTVAGWLALGGGLTGALVSAVAVLIVACPCAMGLATPVSIMVGTGRAAQEGVLFRKGDALQALAGVRAVAFDKTGTLTQGAPAVTDVIASGLGRAELLAGIAAVEAASEHPLGAAIVAHARSEGLQVDPAQDVTATVGAGIAGHVAGVHWIIGSARMLAQAGLEVPPALARSARELAVRGRTPVLAARDGVTVGLIAIADPVRAGSAQAVAELQARGIHVAMLSGDTQATAQAVGEALGIADIRAEQRPEDKWAALDDLRARHGPTAFVGDGINDAPALARADVGIALGTGTDVAIEAGAVVLMGSDPRAVVRALALSAATLRNIRQNLVWAFGYNIALIPVAAGVFAFAGLTLSPMLAALAMALSSVFVVSNALRLRGLRLPGGADTPAPRPGSDPARLQAAAPVTGSVAVATDALGGGGQ